MGEQTGFQPVPSDVWPKPPPRPAKRLILCCDGTWQTSAHGTNTIPSNVAKVSRSLDQWYTDAKGMEAPQVVYYDAGVGTAMGWLDKKWSGGFGEGLDENVCEAYNFLVNNYTPGDEVFLFGFSRGAYTVRATAGLVGQLGICKPSMMSRFWEAFAMYRAKSPETPMEDTDWAKFPTDGTQGQLTVNVKGKDVELVKGSGWSWLPYTHKDVDIKVVGVWDTVGSLGYPDNVWKDVKEWNKPYGFHDTELHPGIKNAFHALALDEHRKPFGPTLWSLPAGSTTNLIQCWFPGYHINVGGGSDDGLKEQKGDLESMANTTFAWMVDRCAPFLKFNKNEILSIMPDYAMALRKAISDAPNEKYGGWGINPVRLVDSYDGIINTGAGSEYRKPGEYFEKGTTHECIHPVVAHAWDRVKYRPQALSGFKRTLNSAGEGHSWVKKYTPTRKKNDEGFVARARSYIFGSAVESAGSEVTITLPEFVIPREISKGVHDPEGPVGLIMERSLISNASNRKPWDLRTASYEKRQKDIEADKEESVGFLEKLDKDNKFLLDRGEIYYEPKEAVSAAKSA